ncbi:MAG TPA: class I SAM-dependent methyltransferase [Sphingopyxis sp.]|nr:class I SAM-dependent methyltransferase [Sphingopyxis sp.]HMP46403.1 class I SAM-dependent methyltransferase [Sphingopyxis sp.]
MAGRKQRDIWEYGDFQTPKSLAADVCTVLSRLGIEAPAVLEPTCGRGAFLVAAERAFPDLISFIGVEINPAYAEEAQAESRAEVRRGDFFAIDWNQILDENEGPWLILGNPPWVTNSELGLLNSTNVPEKGNFQGHRGLDAITGKANFDISEWMLLQQLSWLTRRSGWIAMLVKTSVARKILRQAWKRKEPVGRASIFKIDAMRHFDAAVDACLFVLPVNVGSSSQDCNIYDDLQSLEPTATIGFHDGMVVADVDGYMELRDLIDSSDDYVWRSGVKHDCSKVMELSRSKDGILTNGRSEAVVIEDHYLFPMLKSSDVAKGCVDADRFMIVTQREIGQDTTPIRINAPKTWEYLSRHAPFFDRRGSVIYKNKPSFSIFGIGGYTFSPWKVAISGFYKNFRFVKLGSLHGKPTVLDDTLYFLPCYSEEEADFILSLVQSEPYQNLLQSMVFIDEKRPVTAEMLKRISLERVAKKLGRAGEYDSFATVPPSKQLGFALS